MGKVKEMCIDCDVNNKFAELQLKYDLAQKYIKILTDCLDVKEQLCAFFREQNEQYHKALEEIREIASPHCSQCREIIDKINEVLGNANSSNIN